MAREILVLERTPEEGIASLIFQYALDVADRKTYTDKNSTLVTVVWTPSSGLSAEAQAVFTDAELAAFDDGSAFWKSFSLNIEGLSLAQAQAKAIEMYQALEPTYRAQYAKTYSHIGTFVDVV